MNARTPTNLLQPQDALQHITEQWDQSIVPS